MAFFLPEKRSRKSNQSSSPCLPPEALHNLIIYTLLKEPLRIKIISYKVKIRNISRENPHKGFFYNAYHSFSFIEIIMRYIKVFMRQFFY